MEEKKEINKIYKKFSNKIREEYTEDKDGDSIINLYIDNKLVYTWYNRANVDYPEDLCWDRDISAVFYSGFKLAIELMVTKNIKQI